MSQGKWILAKHLIKLSQRLVDLAARRVTRLIVEMPPRHGKSELISHWFPVWYLNQWPHHRVILTSYESDFAESWGRKVRNTIIEHQAELNVKIVADSMSARRWDTTVGGGMVTAGVGGPIVGRGANLLIMDDPIKNAEEAYSKTYRDKLWDWWRSTAFTRLEPNGVVVVIMTRWHKDDLVGRILTEESYKWDLLKFTALAEDNDELGRPFDEPLWPERFDKNSLLSIKKTVGSVYWSALYQQDPIDRLGSIFNREWFKIVDDVPSDVLPVRFWDLAATEFKMTNNPDWTAGALVSRKNGCWYIHRIDRLRGRPKLVEDFIKQCAMLDGRHVSIFIEQEPGSSGVNTIDHYQRNVLPGYIVKGVRSTGTKVLRAYPVSAAAEAGNVFLLRGPWINDFLDEISVFPLGEHDDQVDAVSGAFEAFSTKVLPGFFVIGRKINEVE